MDAVVSPVAVANWPAVSVPPRLRMFRQFRSVALMPIRSAAAWLISCTSELVLRIDCSNAASRPARPGCPAAGRSQDMLVSLLFKLPRYQVAKMLGYLV